MEKSVKEKGLEKAKAVLLDVADRIPLPLHYVLNAFAIVFYMGDLAFIDPLPFIDEILGAGALYYYNAYLMKRTFGVLNPMRVLRGEDPASKRKMGLLPYEDKMNSIKKMLKSLDKEAEKAGVPGMGKEKLSRLRDQVKEIEKRLRAFDRLLSKPAFQEASVKTEVARIEARLDREADDEIKKEYKKALDHARDHISNIQKLKEERNRLVARLERLSIELDNTFSKLLAAQAAPTTSDKDMEHQFDELLESVENFDKSLKELEEQPSPDMMEEAVREVEETEERIKKALARRESTRS